MGNLDPRQLPTMPSIAAAAAAAAVGLALLAAGVPAAAATATLPACLTGRVLDIAGGPVPGAALTLLGRDHGGGRRLLGRTDRLGTLSAAELAPGAYWLVVERLGFEPEIRPLDLSAQEIWIGDIQLTPLAALVGTAAGRGELPWLLRGAAEDPARDRAPQVATTLEAAPVPGPVPGRAVQGRLTWHALAADLPNAGRPSLLGNRETVELKGTLRDDLAWYVGGRRQGLDEVETSGRKAFGAEELRYGIGYSEVGQGIQFRGELLQARGAGQSDGTGASVERQATYGVELRRGGPSEGLGVSVSYRAAISNAGQVGAVDSATADSRHALWEGQGEYSGSIAEGHRVATRILFRAQRWSRSNPRLLAQTVPQDGFLRDARFLDPRAWQLFLSQGYEWRPVPSLAIQPGVDLARASGEAGPPYVRPHLGVVLGSGTDRLQVDLSHGVDGSSRLPGARAGSGSAFGGRIRYLRELGHGGELRITALRNDYQTVESTPRAGRLVEDHLVFAAGSVESSEIRIDLRTPELGGFAGYASASYGTARGDLGLLSTTELHPGTAAYVVSDAEVRYATVTLGGVLPRLATDISIRYRLLDGFHRDGGDFAQVDIQVDQGLPWWDVAGARLDLMLALRGYFERSSAVVEGRESLLPTGSQVAAGVGVRF